MVRKRLLLLAAAWAAPAFAQEAPLSAIDWLAAQPRPEAGAPAPGLDMTLAPPRIEPPVADSASVPDVEVRTLDGPEIGGVGLLPSSVTGLPQSLWRGSDEAELRQAIDRLSTRRPAVPALQALFHTLLLAEAAPPAGSDGADLLLARIDALYDQGLVEPAEALLERAGRLDAELFSRAFDLALLNGTDAQLCSLLDRQPELSDDLPTRIWCTVRDGDYARAVTIYQTAAALGQFSPLDDALLLRFLDPELAEDSAPLRPPLRPTPLQFRLFEAIGEALPTASLPRPFAAVELSGDAGWKAQLEAAERLARTGAIGGNRMLGVYSAQKRAASGGIWDRVEALQRFESALSSGEPEAVGDALVRVWPQMRSAGLLVPFSKLFGPALQDIALRERAAELALKAGLMSDDYEAVATSGDAMDPVLGALAEIARGQAPTRVPADLPHGAALRAAWSGAPRLPEDAAALARENRLGEALLNAIVEFGTGAEGNPDALRRALVTLRAFGLEDSARRAALQLAILDMEGARR